MATPQQALDAAYHSWNADDLDGYLELYDEEIRLHGYSPEPMTKGQVKQFYEGIFAAFDSPKLEFHETLWDDDACTIRFTMTGRHAGEFMGVPATGTEIALPVITILHLEGDRVIERSRRPTCSGCWCRSAPYPHLRSIFARPSRSSRLPAMVGAWGRARR